MTYMRFYLKNSMGFKDNFSKINFGLNYLIYPEIKFFILMMQRATE